MAERNACFARQDSLYSILGMVWRVIFNPELAISADHVFCLLEASGQWVV